jgi:XTP/dITP diphosphohydrolase
MRVTFVTSNPNKYREVRRILRPFGISVDWRRLELPEPQADSLAEVVRAKLEHVPRRRGVVLVEDSGLFIEGLGGFPGVYARYVYETIGLPGVLRLLKGKGRSAVFRTVAGVRHGRSVWLIEGRSPGSIALTPRGSNGFGYDPVFVPTGSDRTYAQMPAVEKNRTSHRARAMRGVGRKLAKTQTRRTGSV